MMPFFILMGSGACLFCGYMIGSQAGGFVANSLAEFLTPAQITAILFGVIASIGFSVGTSGIANSALMLVIVGSLVGGGWIGFAFGDAALDPVVSRQASAVWHGAGITDVLTFLPGWTHDRVVTFVVAAVLVASAACGAGRLVHNLVIRMIRRSLRGAVLVDDSKRSPRLPEPRPGPLRCDVRERPVG